MSRRGALAGALALAACEREASSQPAPTHLPALKDVAPFPLGTCVQALSLDDPAWVGLAARHCGQLTPEWEMKMEYVVQPDGGLRFDRPDRIADFARRNGMRLHGHALVWYAQRPAAFERLEGAAFARAFDAYIAALAGRYRGLAAGWDVVNEAVAEDGGGWRESLWASRLGGFDHMRRAFDQARAADPAAVLFLNDYNLETLPRKLDAFQRLVERLLAAGAPLGGLGCQSHLAADLPAGAMDRTLQALARFGLPIHLSELDVSLTRVGGRFVSRGRLQTAQAAVYREAAGAFAALPTAQRYALTLWGLRDRDSWLRRENAADAPLLFDDLGQPKPAATGFVDGLDGR